MEKIIVANETCEMLEEYFANTSGLRPVMRALKLSSDEKSLKIAIDIVNDYINRFEKYCTKEVIILKGFIASIDAIEKAA